MMKTLLSGFCVVLASVALSETRVGIIGLDTSHSLAFTEIMNVKKDPRVAGFRVTVAHQWGSRDIVSSTNRYPKYIAEMRKMGVEIVPTIDELLAKTDVVCLETNDGREHLWQAEKVFKTGKPVFIDKPIAHNLHDALKIHELGRRYGAKYFSASALRFSKVATAARAGEYGRILGAALTSPAPLEEQGTHSFYSWYGIHGFEPLMAIMGSGVERVSCFRNDAGDVVNAVWKDGRMGQIHLMRGNWSYTGYVLPEKKPEGWPSPGVMFDGYPGYEPLLEQIVTFFKTGVPPIPPEECLEVMAFMEAAEMSAKRGGEPVTLDEAIETCSDRPFWKFW